MPDVDPRFAAAFLTRRGDATMVVIGAREYTIPGAARLAGLPPSALRVRLRTGWNLATALSQPITEERGGRRGGGDRGPARARD